MDNYTYEIDKYVPEDSRIRVVYEREGCAPYYKMLVVPSFDVEEMKAQIEQYSHVVFHHWARAKVAPADCPIVGKQSAVHRKIKPVVADNTAVKVDDPITQVIVEKLTETEDEIITGHEVVPRPLEERPQVARARRNFMLADTDYWMLSDTPEPTQAQLDYRQALRDVPQQSGFPQNIEWPTL
jgi:hypothetical protein